MMSPWSLSMGWNDATASECWLARCQQDCVFYSVTCDTVRANTSFRRSVVKFSSQFELVVVSRETLVNEAGELVPLRTLWSEVDRAWLVCPQDSVAWQRIVVASACEGADELLAWGQHWSRQFDLPLAKLKLRPVPTPTAWSAVTRWLPWSSPRQHREAIQAGLREIGLGPGDLLLVSREPAVWPFPTNACEASLDDLVSVTPCSMGIAPTSAAIAARELLFPRDALSAMNATDFEIAAA